MNPESQTLIWVAIIGVFGTLVTAIVAGYFAIKGIEKRSGSQNFLEDMQGRKVAQEIVEKYESRQKELENRVSHLTTMLEGARYRHESIFSLGENPQIISSRIEVYSEPRP